MTSRAVVLRPEPGASQTARKARILGLDPVCYPLFEVAPRDWTGPDPAILDAVMVTSANAVRHGGADLRDYHSLPTYAVGAATGAALREMGFTQVHEGAGGATELAAVVAAAGHRRVFHPAGEHVRDFDPGPLMVDRRTVYATCEIGDARDLAALLSPGDCLLVHSPRAGARLTWLVPEADRASYALAAISPAALAASDGGWWVAKAASEPSDNALLALAAGLCD